MLPDELLPATQHYTLLAIATALYTATVVKRQRTAPKLLWVGLGAVGLVPIFHLEMSVFWATTRPWSWTTWTLTDWSLLAHGIAIALVVPIATCLAVEFRFPKPRRKLKLEPTVRA